MKLDVRIGEEVVSGQTLETLERMIKAKTIRADTPVRVDGGPWLPARQIDALRGFFVVDAWEAWDELEDVDEEAVLSAAPRVEPVEEEEEEPPDESPLVAVEPEDVEAIRPVEPDTEELVEVTPEAPIEELEATQVEDLPVDAIDRRGQIIDFPVRPFPSQPRPQRGGAEPAHSVQIAPPSLPDITLPRTAPDRSPASSGPPARWFALAGVIAVAAFAVFGTVTYVNSTAGWTSDRAPTPPPDVEPLTSEPVVVEEPGPEPEPSLPVDDELRELERELRSTMRVDIVDLCTGDAEDIHGALLVELSRLKVQVATVDSPVYRWSESTTPCPEVLDLRVTLTDRGQKSRDLASVALVVGKYIEHHDWQVRELQVSWRSDDGTLRGTEVDPNRVRLFWGAAIGLGDFLE